MGEVVLQKLGVWGVFVMKTWKIQEKYKNIPFFLFILPSFLSFVCCLYACKNTLQMVRHSQMLTILKQFGKKKGNIKPPDTLGTKCVSSKQSDHLVIFEEHHVRKRPNDMNCSLRILQILCHLQVLLHLNDCCCISD